MTWTAPILGDPDIWTFSSKRSTSPPKSMPKIPSDKKIKSDPSAHQARKNTLRFKKPNQRPIDRARGDLETQLASHPNGGRLLRKFQHTQHQQRRADPSPRPLSPLLDSQPTLRPRNRPAPRFIKGPTIASTLISTGEHSTSTTKQRIGSTTSTRIPNSSSTSKSLPSTTNVSKRLNSASSKSINLPLKNRL